MRSSLYTSNTIIWTIILSVCVSCQQNTAISATSAFNNRYHTDLHSDKPASSHSSSYKSDTYGDSYNVWTDLGNVIKHVVKTCNTTVAVQKKDAIKQPLEDCLKRKSLLAIDRALNRDVISIGNGAMLFKWKNEEGDARSWTYSSVANNTTDWSESMKRKVLQFLKTRVLKIRLSNLNFTEYAAKADNFEGRGRRRGNMMAQLLMFALVAAGIIVIPMGFQFLAVLGGKALLLAKLALLLTSIQGLKKIATSHFNYGLYSHGGGSPCLLFLPIDLCATYRLLQQDEPLFLPQEPYNSFLDPFNEQYGEGPFKVEPNFEHSEPYVFDQHIEPNSDNNIAKYPAIENTDNIQNYDPVENVGFIENHIETVQSFDPQNLNQELQNVEIHHHKENSEPFNWDFNFEEPSDIKRQG